MQTKEEILLGPGEILLAPKWQGRQYPVSEARMQDLGRSLRPPPAGLGQLQNVLVRPVPAGFQLVFGYTRHRAATWLAAQPGYADFRLRCDVRELSDVEAFKATVMENGHRTGTNPVDDAVNAQLLCDEFGLAPREIAEALNCSLSWLRCLKKVAALPLELRDRVAAGSLPVIAAINLLELSEEKRAELLAQGTVTGTAARAAVREGGAVLARSVSEVKRYLFAGVSKFPGLDPLFAQLIAYSQGELDEAGMDAVCAQLQARMRCPARKRSTS